MNKRQGIVFIDANMINYAAAYQRDDVFLWMNDLYEEIYVHRAVWDELLVSSVRTKIEAMLRQEKWTLFDPENEQVLSDDLYDLYESFVKDVREAFRQLNRKKEATGRLTKNTHDFGEIHSLAAAMLLSANIICSNDYDIREVINDSQLEIGLDEEEESQLIVQDTLEDFCLYIAQSKIASESTVRKFFKAIHADKIKQLDLRLEQL